MSKHVGGENAGGLGRTGGDESNAKELTDRNYSGALADMG